MNSTHGRDARFWTLGGVLLLVTSVLTASCSPGGEVGESSGVQHRDSAGVELVENLRPYWEGGGGWHVSGEALLRLGAVEGDPAYEFSRITGVTRLGDGTILVADDAAQEVRFFAPDGRVTAVVGGRGEGPGEFAVLSGLGTAPSGGAWAYDFSLRRITWLSPEGRIGSVTSLDGEPPLLHPVGVLSDGSFVLKQLWGFSAVAQAQELGLRRDPVAFVRFHAGGALGDTLALVPGREISLSEEDGRGVMNTPAFARNAVGAIRDDRVVVGTQEDFSLREYDSHGALTRIIRIPGRVAEVTREDLEEYLQGRLDAAPPERHAEIRRSLEGAPHPETRPAYGAILADVAGNLWVAEWAMHPAVPSRWTVLDGGGRWLGDVAMPEGFYPQTVGTDWILGTERDEMDLEYVVLYPLVKD